MVDAYFDCFGLKDSILLLRIDDIDLNAKEGNIMAEHIRKYFIQSNILVLMALKLDQLEIIKKTSMQTCSNCIMMKSLSAIWLKDI